MATVVVLIVVAGIVAYLALAPQGNRGSTTSSRTSTSTSCCSTSVVRIGYFANVNHGQALVGLFNGDFEKALGGLVQIQTTLFTAGPTEMTALLAGKLDMAYVGPSPAVNAFIQSNGTGLEIVIPEPRVICHNSGPDIGH